METFTQALAVILREVHVRELLAIDCVCEMSTDCANLYTRIRAERWASREWQSLRNHYGELCKRAFMKRASKRGVCAFLEEKICKEDYPPFADITRERLTFLREKHTYIEGREGFVNHSCVRETDGSVSIEYGLPLRRMHDITHITLEFTTDAPIGSVLSFTLMLSGMPFFRYLMINNGSGYVCIPTTDGYSGLLGGSWLRFTRIEVECPDVQFGTRVILTGHKESDYNYNPFRIVHENTDDYYIVPYISHPNYNMSTELSGVYSFGDRHSHQHHDYWYGPSRNARLRGVKRKGIPINAHMYSGGLIYKMWSS
jgi:hypothetical protein